MAIKQAVENTDGLYGKVGCASTWVSFTSTKRASFVIPTKVPNTQAYLYHIHEKVILFMNIHQHRGE